MRALAILAAVAAVACSVEPEEVPTGVLWEHRDRLVAALEVRRGQLATKSRKKVRPCIAYWISGSESDALETIQTCELHRRQVRADFAQYLEQPVSDADVRDVRFWRYLSQRAGL